MIEGLFRRERNVCICRAGESDEIERDEVEEVCRKIELVRLGDEGIRTIARCPIRQVQGTSVWQCSTSSSLFPPSSFS